jgi:HEAT repeat protein
VTSSPAELVRGLGADDPTERARSLAALVVLGSAAVPALLEALDRPGDGEARRLAAQGLAEIGDPRTADALAAASTDADPEVRGQAALGLARIGDRRALEALARTIDDLPDPLHHPYTGAVYALIDLGPPALTAVAPLLSAEAPATRQRAFAVVQSVVAAMDGTDWAALWVELGRYDPAGDDTAREAAATQWARWIRNRG